MFGHFVGLALKWLRASHIDFMPLNILKGLGKMKAKKKKKKKK